MTGAKSLAVQTHMSKSQRNKSCEHSHVAKQCVLLGHCLRVWVDLKPLIHWMSDYSKRLAKLSFVCEDMLKR